MRTTISRTRTMIQMTGLARVREPEMPCDECCTATLYEHGMSQAARQAAMELLQMVMMVTLVAPRPQFQYPQLHHHLQYPCQLFQLGLPPAVCVAQCEAEVAGEGGVVEKGLSAEFRGAPS